MNALSNRWYLYTDEKYVRCAQLYVTTKFFGYDRHMLRGRTFY